MSKPAIVSLGTVVIRGGVVFIEDWEFENASCREGARLALVYALERIQKCLTDDIMRDCPTSVIGSAAAYFAE